MLDLYRFNMADLEDVKLSDRSKTAVYDEGQWVSPLGNVAQEWAMSASATVNADAASALAKMLFMEKGRTDSAAVGKMTCVSGAGVRGKTDVFVAADAPTMAVGKPLCLKLDGGIVKLGLAASGDVVKCHVFLAPGVDPDGLLHFEMVTSYVLP